jgi:hypothetical protein
MSGLLVDKETVTRFSGNLKGNRGTEKETTGLSKLNNDFIASILLWIEDRLR